MKRLFNYLAISMTAIAVFAVVQAAGDAASPRRIAVVVSPENPVNSLEKEELQRIFLRDRLKWAHGESITVYHRAADNPIREQFELIVHGKRPSEMVEYWMNLRLTRGLAAPKVCQSTALLKRYLERVSGAIGYLYEDEVDSSMKTVAVLTPK